MPNMSGRAGRRLGERSVAEQGVDQSPYAHHHCHAEQAESEGREQQQERERHETEQDRKGERAELAGMRLGGLRGWRVVSLRFLLQKADRVLAKILPRLGPR